MAALGLGIFIGWADYVLLPLLLLCLGMAAYSFMPKKLVLRTTINCPQCGKEKEEEMPQNACQWFYGCAYCGALLKPKRGDCCVFCSYGKHQCPPKQQDKSCCRGSAGGRR